MNPPQLVLPSNAMPWGRWIQDTEEATTRQLDDIESDASSAGSQFARRADNLARNISGINVATITHIPVPSFSASIVQDFSGPWQNKLSPLYTFTPPSENTATSCIAIATWRVTASVGEAPNWPIMQVNGQQFTDMAHNNQRPVQVYTQGYYSLQGNVPLASGETVSVQFGVRGSPFINSTFVFDQCDIWLAFYGRIA